jgi:hypothetical protein
LNWQLEILNKDWEVNRDWADSVFELDFPQGVTVTDEVKGQTYQVAQVTNQMLADHAEHARRTPITQRSSFRWLVLLGLFGSAAVLLWLYRNRVARG